MARTDLTKTNATVGGYPTAGVAITMTAADTVNQNQFAAQGQDLVIAHNTGVTGHTVTITSAADPYGRTGDITAESIAAGEYRVYGPFPRIGWEQSDGKFYLEANDAEVKFGVIKLPG